MPKGRAGCSARGHQGVVRRYEALPVSHIENRYARKPPILHCDHAVKFTIHQKLYGSVAELRSQHAVACGRLSATLHMPQNRRPTLQLSLPRYLLAEYLADAA